MNAIKVIDYDHEWPRVFDLHRREVETLLGELVTDVHHIGSTSVAGLAAKPKIDMDAVIRRPHDVMEAVERIKPAGSPSMATPTAKAAGPSPTATGHTASGYMFAARTIALISTACSSATGCEPILTTPQPTKPSSAASPPKPTATGIFTPAAKAPSLQK